MTFSTSSSLRTAN